MRQVVKTSAQCSVRVLHNRMQSTVSLLEKQRLADVHLSMLSSYKHHMSAQAMDYMEIILSLLVTQFEDIRWQNGSEIYRYIHKEVHQDGSGAIMYLLVQYQLLVKCPMKTFSLI